MGIETTRPVEKLGGSWVIKLDKGTRKMLNIEKEGDIITLSKPDKAPEESEVESYE